jgi:hypothetical protein
VGSSRHERQYRGDEALDQAASSIDKEKLVNPTYRLLVGIDWATASHQIGVMTAEAIVLEERREALWWRPWLSRVSMEYLNVLHANDNNPKLNS